jgi:hypothetical protein
MTDQMSWFVGLDWATEQHRACLLDAEGRRVAERDVPHGGAGLTELCDWLLERTAAQPGTIAVAIETPRGPVVEALLERGFAVFAVNPKQLDRFRDRFTVAGAEDDSRDAEVLGSSLRSDRPAFRRLSIDDPLVIELREWSRIHEELAQERVRLANRVRDQLWRYYPQARKLGDDVGADWFLDLWQQLATAARAARASEKTIARILKTHRIRRLDAGTVLRVLRELPLAVAPGTAEAASAHIRTLAARLRLINQQRNRGRGRGHTGADLRAARRGDPAFLARTRKDHPRHAARRGLRASAPARLPCPAGFDGCGPGHPPQRQDLLRAAATCLQQAIGASHLSLGQAA